MTCDELRRDFMRQRLVAIVGKNIAHFMYICVDFAQIHLLNFHFSAVKKSRADVSYLVKTTCSKGFTVYASDEMKALSPEHIIQYWTERISWPLSDDSIFPQGVGDRCVLRVACKCIRIVYVISYRRFEVMRTITLPFCFQTNSCSSRKKQWRTICFGGICKRL